MELDRIYKKDVSGETRVWWAEVGEGNLAGYWRTHSGLLDGQIIISEWKIANPKSQDTPYDQALFYANAAMEKRLKKDYRSSMDNINELRSSRIRPMLAKEYVGWQGPCFAQPKLDGMRCLANVSGLWSREDRQIISCPHIEGALKQFFKEYPEMIIDGELYNHELSNFNSIMSMAKKTKPNFADLERSKQYIQYWIYDCFDTEQEPVFEERWNFIATQWEDDRPKCLILTPTFYMQTQDELDMLNIELLRQGYEGQIVRLNSIYEQKRSYNLLKRKEFKDEEFELIDIEEGQGGWQGLAKIAICRAQNGERFGAGISGTQEDNMKLLEEKDKYHSVTVKYQALTPDGIPRFPIAIKFYEEFFDGLEERIKPKRDLFA
jgi:DNA ligase 1